MHAGPVGSLAGVQMNRRNLNRENPFEDLHLRIRALIGDDTGPGSIAESTEIEFDCDYDLDFEHVIDAITAVSGYIADDGMSIIKLIEKIKFTPPKKPIE